MLQGLPDDASNARTLLYIDRRVPAHDHDDRSAITRRYLELLSEVGFAVTFWPDDRLAREPYTAALRAAGIEVHADGRDLAECLASASREIDVVCIAGIDVAAKQLGMLRRLLLSSKARVIYVAHDLHFLRHRRQALVTGELKPKWQAWRMERVELGLMRRCDATVVFSPVEMEIIREMDPSLDVKVWPWVQETPRCGPGFDERWGTVFAGSFAHSSNEDAVLWFAEKVLPLVCERIPEAGFGIVGAHPTARVAGLGSPAVKVIGHVPDLARYMNAARVFVAPLRYGAGIKGEILAAMAHGLPVVTTSTGAEGIGIENEREVLVADAAGDFADAVASLHEARGFWARLSRESLDFVRRHASRERARAVLKADLGAGTSR